MFKGRIFFGDNFSTGAGSNTTIEPASANLALSTFAPTVTRTDNRDITPASANLALSSVAPTVAATDNRDITPASANLALSSVAPTVTQTANHYLEPASANLTLSGVTPTVTQTTTVVAEPATAQLTLTTSTPTVTAGANVAIEPASANLALSAQAPTATVNIIREPSSANLALTSVAPTVTIDSGSFDITPASANLTLSGVAPTVTQHGYLVPDADVSDGSWTNELGGTTLYTSIDEGTADDNDYIQSSENPVSDACVIGISNPSYTPSLPFDVYYRYEKTGTAAVDLTVTLRQGATQIAQWEHLGVSETYVNGEQSLSAGEFAAITDFNDLRVEFLAAA